MSDRGLRPLRKHDADPIAAHDPETSETRASWFERARNSANVCSLTEPPSSS